MVWNFTSYYKEQHILQLQYILPVIRLDGKPTDLIWNVESSPTIILIGKPMNTIIHYIIIYHTQTKPWKLNKTEALKLTAFALPPHCMARSWTHVQFVSSCVDRINVKCTPSERWVAEQSIHRNTPYVTLAHVGFVRLQSKHCCNENHWVRLNLWDEKSWATA